MTSYPLAVVKVGGSLLDWPELPARLTSFVHAQQRMASGGRPVLIAGGGPAADLIRLIDRLHHLRNETAHRLALHAMDLSAQILAAVLPGSQPVHRTEAIMPAFDSGLVPVLVARPFLEEIDRAGHDPLPESWDVTSDTIAARVAVHLGAVRLVLLKSAPLPLDVTRRDAARLGLVDPVFPCAARTLPLVEYLNLREPAGKPERLPP